MFTMSDSAVKLRVILTLHVGAGLLLCQRSGPMYQKIKMLISEHEIWTLGEWVYLGLTWERDPEGIEADLNKYMNRLEPLAVL